MIVYCVDANTILSQPTKIRPEIELVKSYKTIQYNLVKRGLKNQLHHLEKESLKALKNFMTEADEKFLLTTPHIDRFKSAKRVI